MADSIELRTISEADIPDCARIAGLAFENDRHTQLKARSPTDPYNHEEGMRGGLRYWLGKPAGEHLTTLATDESTGETVGWVVWGLKGLDKPATKSGETTTESTSEAAETATAIASEANNDNHKTARQKLEAYTSADMQTWMARLMPPGTRCMYICSIAVHPAWQHKGVGSALLKPGLARADEEGVFCWVHSSAAGADTFAKHGFVEVGKLDLDLDEWNLERVDPPEGEGEKWGLYTFKYMKREADGV
ncbi:hypothetical protein ANO11243_017860 [Dothideomycetidae sp. 11243]|nr:hypothetical protein ANO11243_017860 [fungal sp. No.11243]